MIFYKSGGIHYFLKIFQCRGSVFPSALLVSLPCGAITTVIRLVMDNTEYLDYFRSPDSILKETQAWAGFSFLVGFIIVFRTSQAYTRFWAGCTSTHTMRAEWFDAAGAIIAFCSHSDRDAESIFRFKHILVRLFSMLHASALADLEMVNADSSENLFEVQAFSYDLLDPNGIDLDSRNAIKWSASRVELIFTWIQILIVENIKSGVLSIPAPILSRSFQEIANGMVAFHDAVKLSYIPFPFPYAQTCDCLLCLHWCVVPWVTAQWVSHPFFGFVFVFMQVFILWSLNFIAVEIENPFGTDLNDLDGRQMQEEMNRHLELLLKEETTRVPRLSEQAAWSKDPKTRVDFQMASFRDIWQPPHLDRQSSMPAGAGRRQYVDGCASGSASRVVGGEDLVALRGVWESLPGVRSQQGGQGRRRGASSRPRHSGRWPAERSS